MKFKGVEEAKRAVGPREYLWWSLYFEQEAEDRFKERDKQDWYEAQNAFWAYQIWHQIKYILARDPPRPQMVVEDFLMKFSDRRDKKLKKEMSEEELTARCERSMASWQFAVGLIGGGRRAK